MITFGNLFEKFADFEKDNLERILNTPIKGSVIIRVSENEIILETGQFEHPDALGITIDGNLEYLMLSEFIK